MDLVFIIPRLWPIGQKKVKNPISRITITIYHSNLNINSKKSSSYTQNEAPVIINDHIFNFWKRKKKKSHYGEAGALIKYLQFLNLTHFHWTKVSISNSVSMWLDLNDFIININRYKLVIALTMYVRERSSTFWLDYFISFFFFTRIISLLTHIKIMFE